MKKTSYYQHQPVNKATGAASVINAPLIPYGISLFDYYLNVGVFGALLNMGAPTQPNVGFLYQFPQYMQQNSYFGAFQIPSAISNAYERQAEPALYIQNDGYPIRERADSQDDAWAINFHNYNGKLVDFTVRSLFDQFGVIAAINRYEDEITVVFYDKISAINALRKRKYFVDGQPLRIFVANDNLRMVMQNFPQNLTEEALQQLVNYFIQQEKHDIFAYIQQIYTKSGLMAYMSFLTQREYKEASLLFSDSAFSRYIAQQLQLPEEQRNFLVRCVRFISKEARLYYALNSYTNDARYVSRYSVYLSDLPFNVTESQIQREMLQFGPLKYINIYNKYESKGRRPCATCYFDYASSAASALLARTISIDGQPARIQEHVKKQIV